MNGNDQLKRLLAQIERAQRIGEFIMSASDESTHYSTQPETVDLPGYADRSGYDHNVKQDTCPNCRGTWHGLPRNGCTGGFTDQLIDVKPPPPADGSTDDDWPSIPFPLI